MNKKVSVLMCIYDEKEYIDYAIKSVLPHVDHLVIVEGAYQETIALGKSPRSTDGTIEIAKKYVDNEKVFYLEANEKSDAEQRNVGVQKIKELNPEGWMLIVDGDEVYEPQTFQMIKVAMRNMEQSKKYCSYFKSLTFVNDFLTYTEQEFPRLFKLTKGCHFHSDNHMTWPEVSLPPALMYIKIPYIKYHHYSFCKGKERFDTKKTWWETRFGKKFDYGWHQKEDGTIDDPNHKIYHYTGKHPQIMRSHPKFKEDEHET